MEHSPSNHEIRYERSDVSPRALARFMLILVLAVLVVAYVVRVMYVRLGAWEAANQPPPPIMKFEANRQRPAPTLEDHPEDDLATFQTQQRLSTTAYGWVDKDSGTVRVPVDEAMRMLLAKGLPVAPEASASPLAASGKK